MILGVLQSQLGIVFSSYRFVLAITEKGGAVDLRLNPFLLLFTATTGIGILTGSAARAAEASWQVPALRHSTAPRPQRQAEAYDSLCLIPVS